MKSSLLYSVFSAATCVLGLVTTNTANNLTVAHNAPVAHNLTAVHGRAVPPGAKVYCHYLVGVISAADANTDVIQAAQLGIDAFALNVGDATLSWVTTSLQNLFNAANANGFKLFISMDVYASGAACYASGTSCNGPYDYSDIFGWVFDQPSYALGPNGNPFVSTFSSGGFVNTEWLDWKKSIGRDIYFCPDFDETDGYYNGTAALPGWWYYWGPVVDCIFSWETSWPKRSTPMPDPNPNIGAAFPGDVTMDEMVQAGALANEADYMMGLSSLQYKNSYGANVFRQGGLTLPARMANIFGMSAGPDYIEIQTWNDGPEGHNIGNVWPEENSDLQPSFYMKDHTAWQPLIASFIEAWKAGGSVGSMRVPSYLSSSNNIGVGALWYQALPMNAKCPYDDGIVNGSTTFSFWEKPFGFDAGDDLVYWAFVLEPAFVGGSLEIYSGSVLFEVVMLDTAGLSYASFARSPGPQAILLKDPSGNVLMGASGGECVYGDEECLRYIYDMNFSVVGFQLGEQAVNECEEIFLPDVTPPADVTIDLDSFEFTPPALPSFISQPLATGPSDYVAGDTLQTVSEATGSAFSVDLTLVGSAVSWDSNLCEVDGGTAVASAYCIGESAELMIYWINMLGGPVQTTFRREIPAFDTHFQYHSDWLQPTNDTCLTAHCKLLATAPMHTWTPVGNGTYKGRFHDLHFLHTGQMIGHRVSPRASPPIDSSANSTSTDAVLTKRGYFINQAGPYHSNPSVTYFSLENDRITWGHMLDDDSGGVLDVSRTMGEALSDMVDETSFSEACGTMAINGVGVETGLWNIVRLDDATELTNAQAEADLAGCSLGAVNPTPDVWVMTCFLNDSAPVNSSLLNDRDTDESALTLKSLIIRWLGLLESRTATSGNSEPYVVNDVIGRTGTTLFTVPAYPNGLNGAETWLTTENGDPSVYALANPTNCIDGSITDNADPTQITVVSEHINERVTGRNFLEFVQEPAMDLNDGNGLQYASDPPISFQTLVQWANLPYAQWPGANGVLEGQIPTVGSAFDDFGDSFGSSTNPTVMANLETELNTYKESVCSTTTNPTKDEDFDVLAETASRANTQEALEILRRGFAVFNYINAPNVNQRGGDSYIDGRVAWEQYDAAYELATGQPSYAAPLWTTFMNFRAQRIANTHRTYMNNRLDQLAAPWVDVQNLPQSTSQRQADAAYALAQIAKMRGQIDTTVYYDRSRFI